MRAAERSPIAPLLDLAARNRSRLLDVGFIDPKNPSDTGFDGYRKLVKGFRGGSSRNAGSDDLP